MGRGLGIDVPYHDDLLVPVKHLRRNLPRHDLTKDAVHALWFYLWPGPVKGGKGPLGLGLSEHERKEELKLSQGLRAPDELHSLAYKLFRLIRLAVVVKNRLTLYVDAAKIPESGVGTGDSA